MTAALLATFDWPGMHEIIDVLTLQRYNTRIVVLGTTVLGLAAGIIGTYMLLRRRALFGDALSHATLPGIGIAFLVMVRFGGDGKSLPWLLLGAVISGLAGTLAVIGIRRSTRIKEDAALGIVLSVFFGLGIAILTLIQYEETGNAAGLLSFIYGKTASMVRSDAILIAAGAALTVAVCVLLFKEFLLLSFDAEFAASQGWPISLLDVVMMCLVTMVTVVGLQAVGMILIIALLIIPPAAARFWTDHLTTQLVTAGVIGACSGAFGAAMSALIPHMPAGAVIVLAAALFFVISMLFGMRRGVLILAFDTIALRSRMSRQHLLRALYEQKEMRTDRSQRGMAMGELLAVRSWSPRRLRRTVRRCVRRDLVIRQGRRIRLTSEGRDVARRLTRNHRLWELYLVTHADIAPSHVDRDADQIEHVLSPAMIRELEALLDPDATRPIPLSPHQLGTGGGAR